jgi:hypothetical protein
MAHGVWRWLQGSLTGRQNAKFVSRLHGFDSPHAMAEKLPIYKILPNWAHPLMSPFALFIRYEVTPAVRTVSGI